MPVAALLLLVAATKTSSIDISHYDLARENVVEEGDVTRCDYVLIFRDSGARVCLGPRYTSPSTNDPFGNYGLDEQTLKVTWLIPDRAIGISWHTVPVSQGLPRTSAHILLLVQSGDLKEVYRKGYPMFTHLSAGEYRDQGGVLRVESQGGTNRVYDSASRKNRILLFNTVGRAGE